MSDFEIAHSSIRISGARIIDCLVTLVPNDSTDNINMKLTKRRSSMSKTIWVPEVPGDRKYPLYGNKSGYDLDRNKIKGVQGLPPATLSIESAHQFDTEEECMQWCNDNPSPPFEPREHTVR